ncbi:unnamed protein product [Victoria cruziana]
MYDGWFKFGALGLGDRLSSEDVMACETRGFLRDERQIRARAAEIRPHLLSRKCTVLGSGVRTRNPDLSFVPADAESSIPRFREISRNRITPDCHSVARSGGESSREPIEDGHQCRRRRPTLSTFFPRISFHSCPGRASCSLSPTEVAPCFSPCGSGERSSDPIIVGEPAISGAGQPVHLLRLH